MNLVAQVFIGNVRPLNGRSNNSFELYNDLSVYVVTIHFYLFSDFIPQEKMKSDIGWSCIFFIAINLIVNMTPILIAILKMVKLFVIKNWNLAKR